MQFIVEKYSEGVYLKLALPGMGRGVEAFIERLPGRWPRVALNRVR